MEKTYSFILFVVYIYTMFYILHLYFIFLLLYINYRFYFVYYSIYTIYTYIYTVSTIRRSFVWEASLVHPSFWTFLAANTENTGPRRTTRPMFLQPKKVSISGCIKKIAQRGTSQSIESSKYLSSKSCVKAIVQGLSFLMRSPFFLFESKYLRQEVIIPQMMGIFT